MRTAEIQEMEYRHGTPLGTVLYIRMRRRDYRPMDWDEIWENFQDTYPGQWAVQMFPPREELLNEENLYHLFVLEPGADVQGLNIRRKKPTPKVLDMREKGPGW